MNRIVRLPLTVTPEQASQLAELQRLFAMACNALTPIAAQSRVWNRVALHHMAYKPLRDRFPSLGSQMVCNAIYSVSRICRQVYQDPASRLNLALLGKAPLPVLRFTENCPVYFDRHTLSLKDGQLSLFSPGGRLLLPIGIEPGELAALMGGRLREIVLGRRESGAFELSFLLAPAVDSTAGLGADDKAPQMPGHAGAIPDYVMVEETA